MVTFWPESPNVVLIKCTALVADKSSCTSRRALQKIEAHSLGSDGQTLRKVTQACLVLMF